jgi:circadian clock protein KaiC
MDSDNRESKSSPPAEREGRSAGESGDRVPTGIAGFDSLVEGGIPRGSLVLLAGNPGAGKTSFSAKYLHYGVTKRNEPGIYVSFAESREAFFANSKRMNMEFEPLERQHKFELLDFATPSVEKGAGDILTVVLGEISKMRAKRLVIDSFSALSQSFRLPIEARAVLHTVLGKMVRLAGCTTLLVVEKPLGENKAGTGIEEFVADGVVSLTLKLGKGSLSRKIQVVKMRGTKANTRQHSYEIGDDGVLVTDPEIVMVERVSMERMGTGTPGLDRMVGGGLFKGSTSLVEGPSGAGKTILALHFLAEGARLDQRGLYMSFEEPIRQLVMTGEGFGWPMKEFVDENMITISSHYPDHYTLEGLVSEATSLFRQKKPLRLVIDSLTAVRRVLSPDEYVQWIKSMNSLAKSNDATSVLTASTEPVGRETTSEIWMLMDNVISLRNVEVESALRRSLIIFKARGTKHDRDIREFEITPEGMEVKHKFVGWEQLLAGAPRRKGTGSGEDNVLGDSSKGIVQKP